MPSALLRGCLRARSPPTRAASRHRAAARSALSLLRFRSDGNKLSMGPKICLQSTQLIGCKRAPVKSPLPPISPTGCTARSASPKISDAPERTTLRRRTERTNQPPCRRRRLPKGDAIMIHDLSLALGQEWTAILLAIAIPVISGAVIAVTAIVSTHWRKLRQAELEASLN